MKKIILLFSLIPILILVNACKSITDDLVVQYPQYEIKEDGVLFKDLKVGTGESVKSGDKVRVHYVGTFEDGKEFDSSREKDKPFEFIIDKTAVIDGWHVGVKGMQKGGIRKLVLAPFMGYGRWGNSSGTIPPNTILLFEIEVLEILD